MKIYVDLVFILNFLFDLILLYVVATVLRRNVSLKRLVLGAFLGGCSIFILFIKVNSFELFLIKILISLIMSLATFGFKDRKYTANNLFYLYTASILLGGFLYFLNVQFSYKQDGLIFYHHGLSINFIVLLIFAPLILYTYMKQAKALKQVYHNHYEVDVYFRDGQIESFNGFLDTGNHLVDPYKKRPIILASEDLVKDHVNLENILYVPYDTVNDHGLLKCITIDKVYIVGVGIKRDVLVGISKDRIMHDGINLILHQNLMEG